MHWNGNGISQECGDIFSVHTKEVIIIDSH